MQPTQTLTGSLDTMVLFTLNNPTLDVHLRHASSVLEKSFPMVIIEIKSVAEVKVEQLIVKQQLMVSCLMVPSVQGTLFKRDASCKPGFIVETYLIRAVLLSSFVNVGVSC